MNIYEVIACDGFDVIGLEMCLTREIAELIVESKNEDKQKRYGDWIEEIGGANCQGSDRTFATWNQCEYGYSIRSHKVVCE